MVVCLVDKIFRDPVGCLKLNVGHFVNVLSAESTAGFFAFTEHFRKAPQRFKALPVESRDLIVVTGSKTFYVIRKPAVLAV